MNTVKVDKDTFLVTLRENRKTHEADFKKAEIGYQKAIKAALKKLAAEKKVTSVAIRNLMMELPQPESHVADYDEVIDMADWSITDEIELTAAQFSQYVRDEWNWKGAFAATNSRYVGSA